jgi:sirohydrochlorin cobaltochelatase
MSQHKQGVILVGHGGIPKGCPLGLVNKLKRLESQRRAAGTQISAEELDLDAKIRHWPRTPETDPYQTGLESVGAQLRAALGDVLFAVAYNEFCAPTLEESVQDLIRKGATHITVTTTMFTPGGSHSEVEIPDILDHVRIQYPEVAIRYAWPFDLSLVANTLAEQIRRFAEESPHAMS